MGSKGHLKNSLNSGGYPPRLKKSWWRWRESNSRPKVLPVESTTCVVTLEQVTAVRILYHPQTSVSF